MIAKGGFMARFRMIFAVFIMLVFIPTFVLAQAEKVQTGERQIDEDKLLRKRIETEKEAPKIEEPAPEAGMPVSKDEKAFVKKINVTRVTLLSESEISKIIAPFENRELTLADMRKVTDLITDAYRAKGYVTSRAYLPPQKIKDGVLEIMAVEGTVGDITIKGNKFFRTTRIRKAISLQRAKYSIIMTCAGAFRG
jgi:hemolysin activation/secretion protein